MGFWIFMLCMALLVPIIMAVFGWVFMHTPPGEINHVYGYRTRRSMASQEAWNFAHAYVGRIWFRMGLGMLVLSVAVMIPCMGKSDNAVGIWGSIVEGVECVLLMLPIIPTERALKRRFPS